MFALAQVMMLSDFQFHSTTNSDLLCFRNYIIFIHRYKCYLHGLIIGQMYKVCVKVLNQLNK
jgi:hypothetical protein